MDKGVKMDCVRTLYLYRMATANTPAWFLAKRDASLSSRYYYITLHYYSERELRFEICVTFTFAGFLLFSVMPRDCVAEIESAAPLDTPNVLKMHRSSDLHLARTKVRGNDDDFAFPRWKREHEAVRISRARVSRIYSLIYNIRPLIHGTLSVLQYCYLDPCVGTADINPLIETWSIARGQFRGSAPKMDVS